MCGIAGAIQLNDRGMLPRGALRAMADSLVHRGPDEDGYLELPGLALASRRLSIVGLTDGRQPITNENRDVSVVFNGELFDFPEMRRELEGRGHSFRTHCDTELIPHLWEDHQEGLLTRLRGQFALALWDHQRERLVLARDRFGICPLYWTRQRTPCGEWLLFASEIKALLASGLVPRRCDPRGLNHAFTFFGMPGPVTAFEGVQLLPPGHFLTVQRGGACEPARITERAYWKLEFPDRGQELDGSADQLVERFEKLLLAAVERRLRADVPVVSYLSGGVDSSIVVAMASKIRGKPIPTFTIQIDDPDLDERSQAEVVARYTGSEHHVVRFGSAEVLGIYPKLIQAAEGPVIDTSCGALMMLSGEVHRHGYKVALTGEGADEWLAGYPWYKIHRFVEMLDSIPGIRPSLWLRELFVRLNSVDVGNGWLETAESMVGGPNAWLDVYGLMNANRNRFFSNDLNERLCPTLPYGDLGLDAVSMSRTDAVSRSLQLGARAHLAGLLLNHKGDRVSMANSVETRYPFLDEEVSDFLVRLAPRWKLRGLSDKVLLRMLAERWLPRAVAWRTKAMFRAPTDGFHDSKLPPFVDQLLSEDSLAKTGYFDPSRVAEWRTRFRTLARGSYMRMSIEMGLAGVVATQLWHHTFLDGSLADLPGAEPLTAPAAVAMAV